MFKFNFNFDDKEIETKNLEPKSPIIPIQSRAVDSETNLVSESTQKHEYGVLNYSNIANETLNNLDSIFFKKLSLNLENSIETEDNFIDYVDSYLIKLDQNDPLAKINKTHDLVPGKYEGGLKVWELSVDLARFIFNLNTFDLTNQNELNIELSSIDKFIKKWSTPQNNVIEFKILELGCGHALPTLSMCKYLEDIIFKRINEGNSGPIEFQLEVIIFLQDFNQQILKDITYNNVKAFLENSAKKWSKLNLNIKPFSIRSEFVYGDWADLYSQNVLPENYFNLILTSETIYNPSNYIHLLNLFGKCLAKQDSLVLLSAKTYYFGCGGNIHEFLQLARSGTFNFKCSANLLFYIQLNHELPTTNEHVTSSPFEITDLEAITPTTSQSNSNRSNNNNNDNNNNNKDKINTNLNNSSSIVVSSAAASSIAKEIIKIYF